VKAGDPMLLIMCHCGVHRYAIDSRHVSEVLPRVRLHAMSGAPDWFAGMLVCRGMAIPVMDLAQLTEGRSCGDRLSGRIVVLRIEVRGSLRQIGLLVESVDLREAGGGTGEIVGDTERPTTWGMLHLDEQGVFQLVDIQRLVSENRQAFLFPLEKEVAKEL